MFCKYFGHSFKTFDIDVISSEIDNNLIIGEFVRRKTRPPHQHRLQYCNYFKYCKRCFLLSKTKKSRIICQYDK